MNTVVAKMGDVRGKVAVVTGAGRGIGRGVALRLAREGNRVCVTARTLSDLESLQSEVSALGGEALPLQADMTAAGDIRQLREAVVERWGRVDIVVNNAGGSRPKSFAQLEDADWLDAMALNFMSAVRVNQELLPVMAENGSGCIVNIGSVVSREADKVRRSVLCGEGSIGELFEEPRRGVRADRGSCELHFAGSDRDLIDHPERNHLRQGHWERTQRDHGSDAGAISDSRRTAGSSGGRCRHSVLFGVGRGVVHLRSRDRCRRWRSPGRLNRGRTVGSPWAR